MKIFEKIISDLDFKKKWEGRNFDESWYTHIIDQTSCGYYLDQNNIKKVLFKFQKNVITEKYTNIAISSFLNESKKKHSNRGIAAGISEGSTTARNITRTGQNEGKYIASNISGYFDRPLREHRGILKSIIACRTTAFNLNNKNLWISGLPFIQKCSSLFKKYSFNEWFAQKKEWDSINNSLKII